MNRNPFFINPAIIPENYIQRPALSEAIISTFTQDKLSEYGKYIVGVRGSGKTVLLNYVCKCLSEAGLVVVRLNPMGDMYEELISALLENTKVKPLLSKSKIDFGIALGGAHINSELSEATVSTKEIIIKKLVKEINKKHRILISIDEINKCEGLSMFAQTMQNFIGFDNLDICLLMTGLPENVKKVKADKRSSFLARIMDVQVTALSDYSIKNSYKRILNIDDVAAKSLATHVKGYSYAYQLLGYLLYENKSTFVTEILLETYKETLFSSQYDLIWNTLTEGEKRIMQAIAQSDNHSVAKIAEMAELDTNSLNQYRRSLSQKMLIDTHIRGNISLILPYFDEYILEITM